MENLKIALAGLALAGMCQGVWGSGGICTEHDTNLVIDGRSWGAIEKTFDKVFNGGKGAKAIAEANRVCAIEDSVVDYCYDQIRRVADASTLVLGIPMHRGYSTDSGFFVRVWGNDHNRNYKVRCYASNSGQILRVITE